MSALEDAPVLTLRAPDRENLAHLNDEQTGRKHLSHTQLSTALNCLRKYGWSYVENLELIATPKPLALGRAFHKGIELGDPVAGANLLDRPTGDQAEYDKLLIDKAIVACAAGLYLNRWGAADKREVEYRLRLRSPYTGAYGRTFDLVGAADGVIDHGGYLELIEDKLVTRVDSVTVKRVKLDRQVSLECYALWRITGKPVRVVRYRWVKKPSIRPKQNESTTAYIARLEADYKARPDFYSEEEQTFRSDDDLLLIEAELWEYAEQMRQATHRGFYPRNTSHCSDYGGCAFIPLCVGDPDARALYRPKRDDRQEDPA